MQKTIRHQFSFPHPPELVWQYLTTAELLEQWLMPNDFKAVVGQKFTFKTKPKVKFSFDGTVYCEVLEIVPNKKLVYSWKGGLSQDKPTLDTTVTWTLTPTEQGTDLLLEQAGFKGVKNYMAYFVMNFGWIKISKRLLARLNSKTHAKATT